MLPSPLPPYHTFIHQSGTVNCYVSHSILFPQHLYIPNSNPNPEPLVWFKVPGFWSPINTGLSLKRLSDMLLLPTYRVILWLGRAIGGRILKRSRSLHTSCLQHRAAPPTHLARPLHVQATSSPQSHAHLPPEWQAVQAAAALAPC